VHEWIKFEPEVFYSDGIMKPADPCNKLFFSENASSHKT
jgi:hypothetical protein